LNTTTSDGGAVTVGGVASVAFDLIVDELGATDPGEAAAVGAGAVGMGTFKLPSRDGGLSGAAADKSERSSRVSAAHPQLLGRPVAFACRPCRRPVRSILRRRSRGSFNRFKKD
jgi:hypothetical protein